MPRPVTPPVAVDIIIEYAGGIVLIERRNEPYGFALPGGFVDDGEALETAAVREALEETSLNVALREMLYVYGKPSRDPRGQTVSIVYTASAEGTLEAGDDAKGAGVFSFDNLPANLVFDHREILSDYRTFLETGRRPSPRIDLPK